MKRIIAAAVCMSAITISASAQSQSPVLVKDIDTAFNTTSNPRELTSFNNKLYFVADAKRWNGFGMVDNRELWMSNGSESGTRMVVDLNNSGVANNLSTNPIGLKVWNNKIYFFGSGMDGLQHLFETDGTAANTRQVSTKGFIVLAPTGIRTEVLTEYNNALYFVATDWSDKGYELWKTDGTEAGTVLVKEINPAKGVVDHKSDIHQLTVMGNHLYFMANDQSTKDSLQIWKTDGTEAGTAKFLTFKVVNDLTLYSLTATDSFLYFTHGKNIYKSDGTTNGTILWKPDCEPYHLTRYKNEMLFIFHTPNPFTMHLAITSSDSGGYTVIKKGNLILSAVTSVYYMPLVIANNKLYYHIAVTDAEELWESDGTVAGTKLVRTFPREEGYVVEQDFATHQGEVYFVTRKDNDEYLYKTDGTAAGTVAVSTSPVSSIDRMTSVDRVLFFTSDQEVTRKTGVELWKIGADTTSGGGSTGLSVIDRSDSWLLYPNPAQARVHFRLNGEAGKGGKVILYDMSGKQLEELPMPGEKDFSHDISGYANGTYFYHLVTSEGVAVKKIVIAR